MCRVCLRLWPAAQEALTKTTSIRRLCCEPPLPSLQSQLDLFCTEDAPTSQVSKLQFDPSFRGVLVCAGQCCGSGSEPIYFLRIRLHRYGTVRKILFEKYFFKLIQNLTKISWLFCFKFFLISLKIGQPGPCKPFRYSCRNYIPKTTLHDLTVPE